ncbi:probable histone-lysine N-methyltransferase CG1716 [Malaya genurostris]|uniref:probable histone-lysine N-methyltransferase CG1716 n=1 Tax=Malaya genurostris TaxID=325434 RepID=UPI0026F3A765|nr:probable histone-lysine N-methyltransferase CG1716 [Malaya genurostris]
MKMVRTTRTSTTVTSNTPSPRSEEKEEPSPESSSSSVVLLGTERSDKIAAASNLSPSVVLQKLPMEQMNPNLQKQSSTSTRATRSQKVPYATTMEEDNVKLIEIMDDDSKSHESTVMELPESCVVKLNDDFDDITCAVITKDHPNTPGLGSCKRQIKRRTKSMLVVDEGSNETDYDSLVIEDFKQTVSEKHTLCVLMDKTGVVGMEITEQKKDKRSDEDDAISSVSSGPSTSLEREGDISKAEVIGTRKSKRQVKVTNKYRDFVVDAPLPSSQVPYSDVKLARGNGGGRKSHVKEIETTVFAEDLCPESPPMLFNPPKKTYINKKVSPTKLEGHEKPMRRMTRSKTPTPRGRKKAELMVDESLLQYDDATVELPGPDDKNDSTLTVNIDSSYFSDDDFFRYDGTPSPEEFCGWPEEDIFDPGAGPSFSTLSTLSAFAFDPFLSNVTPLTQVDNSNMDDKLDTDKTIKKRRGRTPKVAKTKPVVTVEEPTAIRPAGSTFIKRSYKTAKNSQENLFNKVFEPDPEPVKNTQPVITQQSDIVTSMSTVSIDDGLEDAIEIVLQAEEIITDNDGGPLEVLEVVSKPPRNRRRIRGGRRPSPSSALPRRGRSQRDSFPSTVENVAINSDLVDDIVLPAADVIPEKEKSQLIEDQFIDALKPVTMQVPVEELNIKTQIQEHSTAITVDNSEKQILKVSKKTYERRKSVSKSAQKAFSTGSSEKPKKEIDNTMETSIPVPKTPDTSEIIVLEIKDIIPSEPVKDETLKDKEELSKKDTQKESKKSSKESSYHRRQSTSKDVKKSKEHKDHSSSKEHRDRDSSRKDRDSSRSHKDRDKEKHRKRGSEGSKKDRRSNASESEKKRSEHKEFSGEKKHVSDKKRSELDEKKSSDTEKPKPPVPKTVDKPKKCFDSELQAMDPSTIKNKQSDESKRSKEYEKNRKSDKHRSDSEIRKKSSSESKYAHKESKEKHRSAVSSPVTSKYTEHEARKKESGESKSLLKESKEKNRSIESSPVTVKSSSSSSSKKSSKAQPSSNRKESSSSSSSKSRKSLSSSIKDEKPKDESTTKIDSNKEKIKETILSEAVKLPCELESSENSDETKEVKEKIVLEQVANIVLTEQQEPTQHETPRIATKASRKMYQCEEDMPHDSVSPANLSTDQSIELVKQECKAEFMKKEPSDEEAVQKISEAFDTSVQISGQRPEIVLKAFENINISEDKPSVNKTSVDLKSVNQPSVDLKPYVNQPLIDLKPVTVVDDSPSVGETEHISSPPPQEVSNEDSNSNNSVTLDYVKEMKTDLDDGNIRRSSRIKTISSQKQRTSGHGLVKDKDKFLKKTTISVGFETKVLKDALTGSFNVITASDFTIGSEGQAKGEHDASITNIELSEEYLRDMEEKLGRFETIRENLYQCDKIISKEAKKMMCDCFMTSEETERGELGCGEDCLNKLLMIECGSRCVVGDRCTNKRFQKQEYANCQVFRTDKKGFGIQASIGILPGEFIMEYVGEVLNSEQFDVRAEQYSEEKNKHYYFMALRSDAIIDATTKGNISRFINHSCDPNAETQKWTVNGELRIGFFSTKYIMPGEEITFDYQFQRYGRRAQKCYCEAANCTGWIGGDPGSDGESEYEDEEEIEESEEEEITPETATVSEILSKTSKLDETSNTGEIQHAPAESELNLSKQKEPTVTVKPPEPKPKKVRKRTERAKKRRPQIHEDPDLEKEINNLLKTGLKNQAQTLKLSRLMVRAKDIKSRSRLLTILQSGELPCRRLFLDYHGLRLLYGWICESTESVDDLKFRIQILDTLDRLPIPNKTMLKDSKILQTIEKWARIDKPKEKEVEKEKERETSSTSSPSDSNGAGSDSNTSSSDAKKQDIVGNAEVLKNMPELLKLADLGKLKEIISSTCVEKETEKEKPSSSVSEPITSAASLMDSIQIPEPEDENAPEEKRLGTQIRILSCKLLISWINLKEVFRIPKKERIEQMKEHEREADLRYKALGLGEDDNQHSNRHTSSRFFDRTRELKRRKSVDEASFYKMKRALASTANPMLKMDKQQRRQMFEMKVAHEEAERRNKELWLQHENNCLKFGLNPHLTAPQDLPAKMNPATGEYFSADDRLLPTPPSHVYFKVLPPPMSTDPEDYELPPMDLPPLWKFAIDERGLLYYYHVKDRVPQWEPPKKDTESGPGHGLRDEDISMSSDSSTTDTEDSEEEYLNIQLEQLLKRKKKQQSSFNLDDVLAKPDDMNDDLSKTIKDLDGDDSTPHTRGKVDKALGDTFEKTAEELLQHRKRKHSNKLVQERIISPRTEEDKLYGQMEMKRYKETKEKLRRRKEEAKRLRARSMLDKSLADSPFSGSFSADILDKSAAESALIDDDLVVSHKIVDDKCIVDELDILTKKKKISPYEEWQKVKQRLGKKRAAKTGESSTFGGLSLPTTSSTSLGGSSSKIGKRKKPDKLDINSDEAKKIKEKFRGEIAGVIVQHLGAYRKDSCQTGRITNTEDFKHLARKLTHFVLVKELKHCDNTINELEVTDSVRTKAREFIKKYMAKHGSIYVRGENEPDYASINL